MTQKASRPPRPAPTQISAALLQVQLCQVLLLDQLTLSLRAAAAPAVLQRAPAADLRTPHREEKIVKRMILLQASRAQAGHLGSSGLRGEAAGHQILMGVVAAVAGEVVAAAVVQRGTFTTSTKSGSG